MTEKLDVFTTVSDENFLPVYASEFAAGADVKACISVPIMLEPNATVLVPTGLCFSIRKAMKYKLDLVVDLR